MIQTNLEIVGSARFFSSLLEVIEAAERIEQILPRLDEMLESGLITLANVRVIQYRAMQR